ncbi:hypothetical protein ACS7SF_00835 [Ralstonia sp. 25C]|uniref:hypothetical protein n=1 Tax=Ralstonia sp. 25C TaxID=3447363 RepID=UPI003F74EC5F
MKKTASTALAKYNVPIKARKKVTSAMSHEPFKVESTALHTIDGRVLVVREAPSTTVNDYARKVIRKHGDVIKRLAKR